MVGESAGVHATGHVDGVAPDVVLRLLSADNARYCWTVVQTCVKYTNIGLPDTLLTPLSRSLLAVLQFPIFTGRISEKGNAIASVRLSVRLIPLYLKRLTADLELLHARRSWP